MSFILDALKKSENERAQQAEAEFASVPSSPDMPSAPRWLWVLGALLVVNVIVLSGLLLRDDTPAEIAGAIELPDIVAPDANVQGNAGPSFEEQVAEARMSQPDRSESGAEPLLPDNDAPPADMVSERAPPAVANPPQSTGVRNAAVLPSLTELRANGSLTLPDLHVDIHVYSDLPEERFVFINMSRYRERATIAEGPVVDEITRDGVVLTYRGLSFMLARDD